jgi:hypothetical protein
MASVVVGLLGKKESGKDALAGFLVQNHGWKRFAFADLLRQVVYGIDPLVRVEEDELGLLPLEWCVPLKGGYWRLTELIDHVGWDRAKKMREVRRLLQRTGTEGVRSVDDDFWWRETMKLVDAEPGPVVITDCRFPNECVQARQRGLLVRINRPGTDQADEHASETAWLDQEVDFVVENDGTLRELGDGVDGFAAGIADGTYDLILDANRDPIIDVYEDGRPFRHSDLKAPPQGAVGLFQFMSGTWPEYVSPGPAPGVADDDYDVIRQRHRDALQRWHNKD